MPGEQSVHSDEGSELRKVLEKSSPDSTFSFRSELSLGPDSHKGHRVKTHRSSSHRRHRSHRDRDRDRAPDGAVLEARQLSRLLAQDEIEAADMRRVLIKTSERLEEESRRANSAELRAREAEARALAFQAARQTAQAEALREQEALKAYQAQLEVARSEILRAQKELDSMAAERERAEEQAAMDRSKARAMTKEIEIQRALEQGREEGKTQGFVDGRKEGWYIGTRDGRKEVLNEMLLYDRDDAGSPTSFNIRPPTTFGQPPQGGSMVSMASTATRSAAPQPATIMVPTPVHVTQNPPQATSTRTATPQATHKRSGSLTQTIKSRPRGYSDTRPPEAPRTPVQDVAPFGPPAPTRTVATPENLTNITRPRRITPSNSRERISPIPMHNAPPSPRHTPTSPLPGGYIPLQENGRVVLPPPHEIDAPPPSPHSPALPLPELTQASPGQNLLPPNITVNIAPTITVQEPTPPEPAPITMPEAHPAPPPSRAIAENNVKPSKVVARDYAFSTHSESPPLPPLPNERPNKGKQRQRGAPPRAGTGLHAPGRSSPSDTSTEFSQFDIVEQPERVRGFGMGRGNGSQLSVIMEGGSTAAESPEPMHRHATPRMGNVASRREHPIEGPPSQNILNDPREYGDFQENPLSPSQLAHRRAVAEELRWPKTEVRNEGRSGRDDVSIKSSTTRTSAPPRRRPNVKMPERLAASRDVETLEKQAEMYDAFGTGRFPSFDSGSSPEEAAVSTRTPDFRKGHRRGMSSTTSVPEITIQPPSRPSSKGSKINSINGNRLSPDHEHVAISPPDSPSRRHSMQGPFMTPSRVPLPHTSGQFPISLGTPNAGEFDLPPGFVPTQGPPTVMEAFSSKTPKTNTGVLPSKTPKRGVNTLPSQGGPSNFAIRTPGGVPLPLSTATTTWGLPDNASSAPRTARSTNQDLPRMAAPSYEPAPVPPDFKYPAGFSATPARMPLPESVAGTPWSGWGGNSLGAGATPGPSMPATLSADRPNSLYAGDKKVSSSSLASSYKKFEPSTYLDPAYLASTKSMSRADPEDDERAGARMPSRAGSVRSTNTDKSERRSRYAASVETVTDEDEPSQTSKT